MYEFISHILLAFCLPGQNIPEKPCDRNLADYVDSLEWNGQMNALSKEHMRWGIIYQAAQVSRKPCVGNIPIAKLMPSPNSMLTSAVYEPLTVRQVIAALCPQFARNTIRKCFLILCISFAFSKFPFVKCFFERVSSRTENDCKTGVTLPFWRVMEVMVQYILSSQ
jgi:hypothetical protein